MPGSAYPAYVSRSTAIAARSFPRTAHRPIGTEKATQAIAAAAETKREFLSGTIVISPRARSDQMMIAVSGTITVITAIDATNVSAAGFHGPSFVRAGCRGGRTCDGTIFRATAHSIARTPIVSSARIVASRAATVRSNSPR